MIADWSDFFEGQVAAAAALTGLVFVALSINLKTIVGHPALVGRAGEALLLLVQPVFVGLAALTASQSRRALGIEVLIIVALIAAVIVRILVTSGWRDGKERSMREFVFRSLVVVAALIPAIVGAVLLVAGNGDGLYCDRDRDRVLPGRRDQRRLGAARRDPALTRGRPYAACPPFSRRRRTRTAEHGRPSAAGHRARLEPRERGTGARSLRR